MELPEEKALIRSIQTRARSLRKTIDLKPLIDKIGQTKIVMLGEASHGTHEFYEWRRLISEWLIVKYGFQFIAVEGDWPPCWELNRYVRLQGGESARQVLERFRRWPTWMWANTEIIRFAEWMRSHNQIVPPAKRVGFYGLDVYSFFESIDAVLSQLEKISPLLARRARIRYGCLDPFRPDEKAYIKSLFAMPEGCRQQIVENLQDLLALRLDGEVLFDVQQNARVVANAEIYYRTLIEGNEDSWNVRDRHMLETLDLLLNRFGPDTKGIVWAHNTHIGDYRATDMASAGQVNLGGLAREKWGEGQVALVGLGTYQGKVTASHAWDGPIETMTVPPSRTGSYESSFHEVATLSGSKAFFIDLGGKGARKGPLSQVKGHRAIGVVYHPAYERFGNYVPTSLAHRYDAFIFIDETTALEPLILPFESGELPEAWPRGV